MVLRSLRLCAILVLACSLVAPLGAQGAKPSSTGGLLTSLTILAAPLSAVGVNPLAFGVIIPGTTSVTVLPRTAGGGEWRIQGIRNRKAVDISFTLPASLTGPSGATIPLSFNGNYAGLCEIDNSGQCDVSSYTTWNPVTTPTYNDTPSRVRPGRPRYDFDEYAVYIGGEALPAAGQRAGRYTGTISVTLVVN
ncbi:MAG TPA: DUF4402 domain-containing protein [Longimicrobiaceae bacterium]|nr:DUF4402 domain-containing protein [Longimicrobiaceae bacterium]